ncbi:hypothetical protein ANAPC5_01504 [Anaplasma phagocytophilum]|nr:hypothetical protein ANAPC5_01504 [Anaplasma phagocytophilum]
MSVSPFSSSCCKVIMSKQSLLHWVLETRIANIPAETDKRIREREVCRGRVALTALERLRKGLPTPSLISPNLSFVIEEDSATLREEDTAHS